MDYLEIHQLAGLSSLLHVSKLIIGPAFQYRISTRSCHCMWVRLFMEYF